MLCVSFFLLWGFAPTVYDASILTKVSSHLKVP
jgi:hypothetical protein